MNMSPPTKAMERHITAEKVLHDGNPVMSWMLGNVQIFKDANDNKKIHKGKSTDKVDGAVAMANAFGAHLYEQAHNKEETYFFV